MSTQLTENAIEQMALDELQALGWQVAFGPDSAFDCPHPERDSASNYGDVVLLRYLHDDLFLEPISGELRVPDVEKILENGRHT